MNAFALFVRFCIGGLTVVTVTWLARRVGGRIGGILSTFPSVFVASIFALSLNLSWHSSDQLIQPLAYGSILGMLVDIVVMWIAYWSIQKIGLLRGIVMTLGSWVVLGLSVALVSNFIS